jgi:hypothetical protein
LTHRASNSSTMTKRWSSSLLSFAVCILPTAKYQRGVYLVNIIRCDQFLQYRRGVTS